MRYEKLSYMKLMVKFAAHQKFVSENMHIETVRINIIWTMSKLTYFLQK